MKYLNYFLIINLLFFSFCPVVSAQGLEQPKTMEEAKGLGLDILTKLPGAVLNVWHSQVYPFLMKLWSWFKDIWDSSLGAKVNIWWQKIINWSGKETPNLQVELQKEIQETQTDLPKVGNTLWGRFQAFFK
jgi:hypothetical protein